MAAAAPFRARQLVHLYKPCLLDPLKHQLGYPLTTPKLNGLGRVVVDHDDLDLTAIPRVDRPRGVYQAQPGARSEARTRVDECGVAIRQRYRDASRQQRTLPWREGQVLCRHDVRPSVAG